MADNGEQHFNMRPPGKSGPPGAGVSTASDDREPAGAVPAGSGLTLDALPEITEAGGIDIAELVRETRVFDVLEDLDRELVGLAPVKTRIREVAALLIVDMLRRRVGLDSER